MDTDFGVWVPSAFPKEAVEKAIAYKPSENDIFIATFPKCGTTWVQQIVYLLLNEGQPPSKTILFSKAIPFLEFCEPQPPVDGTDEKRSFKTHLPFHLIPFGDKSKYIYCVRNPKDCCVSFWYHERDFPLLNCNDFHQFFNVFVYGNPGYGNYFDHLKGWLNQRHRDNVLIVHYEDLKKCFVREMRRIARFIDHKLIGKLDSDQEFLEKVVKFSSFEFMRDTTNNQLKTFYEMPAEELRNDQQIVDRFRDAFCDIKESQSVSIASEVNFVRSGRIGDYSTHLTEEENSAIDDKIRDKLKEFPELIDKWHQLSILTQNRLV